MNDKLKFTVYDAPDIMCVSLLLLCLENIVIRQNHNFFEVKMFEVSSDQSFKKSFLKR